MLGRNSLFRGWWGPGRGCSEKPWRGRGDTGISQSDCTACCESPSGFTLLLPKRSRQVGIKAKAAWWESALFNCGKMWRRRAHPSLLSRAKYNDTEFLLEILLSWEPITHPQPLPEVIFLPLSVKKKKICLSCLMQLLYFPSLCSAVLNESLRLSGLCWVPSCR